MTVLQRHPDPAKFNPSALLPFGLRTADFAGAMQDIYDFLFDVNSHLTGKDLASGWTTCCGRPTCRACFPTCSR